MNKRVSEVGYRPFRVAPVLDDGLLRVDRPDGGPERRVAAAFERVAAEADAFADQAAAEEGRQAGISDALANGPRPSDVSGGITTTYEGGAPGAMAYAPTGGGAPAGSRVATGGKDLDERGRYIYQGLRKRGFSHIMAAASVGHGRQESTLHSDGPDGDKGTSSGVWQWRNERRTALQGFARSAGKDWRDVDTQMDFFVHELKTSPSERLAWNRLQSATDIVGATEALMHFERPQYYNRNAPRRGHGWDNRLANARWAMAFGSDSAPAAVAAAPVPDAPAASALVGTPPASGAAAAIDAIAPRDGSPPAAVPAAASPMVPTPTPAPRGEPVKAEPAPAAISPEEVGPPRVNRTVEPVSFSGGRRGSFTPQSGLTIRGRAYNAAGQRTYLEQLDETVRADADAVYQRFKDDPAELDKGFAALRTLHMDESVLPEIRAEYDSTFGRVTRAYSTQARQDAEKRKKETDLASFLTRAGEMETMTARAVAGFDASNGDADAAIASAQSATDAHYDSAVARGIIAPDDAARAKATSRRNTAVAFYERQAQALTSPDEVAALKEKMRTDFASGGMEGLDGPGWTLLEASLDRTQGEKRVLANEAARSLKARGDAMADAAANGIEIPAAEMGRFMLDRKTATGGPAIVDGTLAKIGAAQVLRGKSIAEAERYVLGLEKDRSAITNGTADFARAELERMRTAANTDPLALAERKGLIPPDASPLEGATVDEVAGRLNVRVQRAEAAAEHFGVMPKYLKAEEKAAIRHAVETDPEAAARLAAGIARGAGSRSAEVFAELGEDAPSVAQAGIILAALGSERAASDVIAGYATGPDGKPLPEVMDRKTRQPLVEQTLGGAYAARAQDGARTVAAAEAIARVRISRAGIDPKSEAAAPIFERALQEASGATFEGDVQWGGVARVPVGGWFGTGFRADRPAVVIPPTIRADRFADVIDAIRDTDLQAPTDRSRVGGKPFMSAPPVREDGTPYLAADLKAATPVRVAHGYRFAAGDPASDDPQWIRGSDGAPVVFSFDRMRPFLEPRVPGAYR